MASLTKKMIRGKAYYYLRETARVDGKPKVVSQQYVGTADDLAALLSGGGLPDKSKHLGFGDIAAVWSVLLRLGVAEIIDSVVGSKRSSSSLSVGTYLSLIIANRVVAPRSKLGFVDWWRKTTGDRITNTVGASMDHRRFWDAMDAVSEQQLIKIERLVFERMISEFSLEVNALSLDMTNFATFIDSHNERNTIGQRGHAKQKRNDLRLVGLGLVVTQDGGIPIASHVYAGNRPDVTQFGDMITELSQRYNDVTDNGELTVVYDAGQGSAANYEVIDATGLGFVSSAAPSDHVNLLAVPASKFIKLDAFDRVRVHETTQTMFKKERRVVVCHSQELHDKQALSFEKTTLAKAAAKLNTLATRLAGGKTQRGRDGVIAEVEQICSDSWLKRTIAWELTGDEPKSFRLSWSVDSQARQNLETEVFGKRILFTNKGDWSVEQIVAAYRSQSDVEGSFRQMKDPHVVGVSPMFHWTDQKIRVQLLCCVFALATAHLMRREVNAAGINSTNYDSMSVRAILDELNGIQQTNLIYETGGRPRVRSMLTDMNETQQQLFELFGLETYRPKR
jgi:transposase